MTAINKDIRTPLDQDALDLALRSLAFRLEQNRADAIELVVCGGSALILTGMVVRTTQDVEIEASARWAMTHDVSEGFAVVLKQLLRSIGYATVADKL